MYWPTKSSAWKTGYCGMMALSKPLVGYESLGLSEKLFRQA